MDTEKSDRLRIMLQEALAPLMDKISTLETKIDILVSGTTNGQNGNMSSTEGQSKESSK